MVLKLASSLSNTEKIESVISICPPSFSDKTTNLSIFKLPISIIWLIRPLMSMKATDLLFGPNASKLLKEQEKEASSRNPIYMFRSFYNGIDHRLLSLKSFGDRLHVPVLLVAGSHDNLCPASGVEEYFNWFKSSQVRFEIIPDSGHQSMQEEPKRVNQLVESFIESL